MGAARKVPIVVFIWTRALASCCPLLCGLLFTSTAQGATVADLGSGLRTEAAAGLAPRSYGVNLPSEPALSLTLLPTTGLRVRGPSSTLTVIYQQRWYMRQPNTLNYERPLLFNRLTLDYLRVLTERLTLRLNASGGGGAMDFMATPTMLQQPSITPTAASTGTAARPFAPSASRSTVLQLVTFNAGAQLGYQLTQRNSFSFAVSATRASPLHSDSSGLRRSQQLSTALGHGYRLSERTQLQSEITASDIRGSMGARYESLTLQSSIAHQWTRRTTVGTSAGASAFFPQSGAPAQWFPSVGANATHTSGRQGRRLTLTATASYGAYFDPLVGALRSTVVLGMGAARVLGRHWSLLTQVSATLPATSEPRPVQAGALPWSETFAMATASLARGLGTQARFETGMRYMLNASHPSNFQVLSRQAWLFVAISLWEGTAQGGRGAWVL